MISIIIPVYNVEKYLERCVNSVLKQSYNDLEIILVDDGSTDNSGKICDRFKKKDDRIIVIHQRNQGLSAARNIGITKANGEYIAFVDSDDYILDDMYETLYKNLIKNDADISICKYQCVSENQKIDFSLDSNNIIIMDKVKAMNELLLDKTITNHAWNKLYKKDIFNNTKFPIGKKFEDIGTMYLLFEKAQKIVYQDTTQYIYINRDGSILHNKNPQLLQDYISSINSRYEYLLKRYKSEYEEMLNYNLLFVIIQYHIIAIGQKQKKMYYSNLTVNEYKKLLKIAKNTKIVKKLKLKYKLFLCLLLLSRNLTYMIFSRIIK